MKCSDEKPCNKSDCPDCQNERYREQYAMRREVEKEYTKLEKALKELIKECPTSLTCEDVSHNRKGDLHDSEEDCPPLCRYYKALFEATEALHY